MLNGITVDTVIFVRLFGIVLGTLWNVVAS